MKGVRLQETEVRGERWEGPLLACLDVSCLRLSSGPDVVHMRPSPTISECPSAISYHLRVPSAISCHLRVPLCHLLPSQSAPLPSQSAPLPWLALSHVFTYYDALMRYKFIFQMYILVWNIKHYVFDVCWYTVHNNKDCRTESKLLKIFHSLHFS